MTPERGAPLWASLFEPPRPATYQPAAPWYKKDSQRWEGLSWPLPTCEGEPWERRLYVALDVETTGLDPISGRVVEIALVQFLFDPEGALLDERRFASLVNPNQPIPQQASRIHGITDADVANEPVFGELATRVASLCEGRVLVGHNIQFDIGFIEQEFARGGHILNLREAADTYGLAKLAFPSMLSYNLGKLAFALGLDSGAQHRALGDTLTSMRLFAAAMRALTERC